MNDKIEKATEPVAGQTTSISEDKPWEFVGWGRAERITSLPTVSGPVTHLDQAEKHELGTWSATAICGNDITSSCLYVSALWEARCP